MAFRGQPTARNCSGCTLADNCQPIFVLYNVVMAMPFDSANPTANCCVLGYHNAFAPGGNIQTYGVGDFDSSLGFNGTADISALKP